MIEFTPENLRKFQELSEFYPTKSALTLPVLRLLQEQEGSLNSEALEYAARLLEEHLAQVRAVASFYSLFHEKPVGKFHIQVCTNVACMLSGVDKVVERIEKKLGIKPGEITPDGKFSLEEVECLGACGTAPVIRVNEDYHEKLNPGKVDTLLDSLGNK